MVVLGQIAKIDAMNAAESPTVISEQRPNILVIYTDDQGYGDVSALNPNAKFPTPNMDRLAREGITFTNAHSSDSVCTPSRYGLLTGRYCWRTKLKQHVLGAEAECLITEDRMTIASLLQQNGYHTAMVGKWHLGMDFPGTVDDRDWSQPIQDMPLDKGFDYFFGVPASLNYGILAWFENRHAAVPPTRFTNKKTNPRYLDYRIKPPYDSTAEQTQATLKRPGFEVAPDFVDNQCLTRFTDKAIEWMSGKMEDVRRGEPFFLYLPYTSPHYPVCPLPEFQGRGDCGAYGEFLIETDHHLGRILSFLRRSGIEQNTMIVFTSDNGPEKRWSYDQKQHDHDSRGGLREGKRSVYEGGHRVPFFIRWPAAIDRPSRSWDGPVGQIDLLATFAELINVALPESAGEDSQSFASILLNADANPQRLPLINHGNDGRYSITQGNWKLILPGRKRDAELYDLSTDRSEKINLAGEHPLIAERLTRAISRIVTQGRTTPGSPQPNDTGYWKDLSWMTKHEFDGLQVDGQLSSPELKANQAR